MQKKKKKKKSQNICFETIKNDSKLNRGLSLNFC